MGKSNFQYDETGNTYSYVALTFLGLILIPSTIYWWPKKEKDDKDKKKKYIQACAEGTSYWQACAEKAHRMQKKDPWAKTRRSVGAIFLLIGWGLFGMIAYQASQFDYEMANFDPYEILQVGMDATPKEIKKKYREMSLIYHPDKPTGNEKLFMKLTKAYDALTDETARYNWEHYGNPDGPQAMQFGIGLPAWIVEERNSIWVLGLYTLVFMVGLPTVVYYWWSNSIKFSGEQVLLDTTQLYYYFFHKTPHMMLRRVLMVLAASLEFERGHNSEVVERPTDNVEIPQLMKGIHNLGLNNKEKPLCFGYSVKARALLFAHLSRIALPFSTLHLDRLFVIKKCPFLIQEMVNCISQLILLAHAGRIGRLPSLDTIEHAMKMSPLIVQALWDKSSPLLQLPHIEEDMLKHFHSRKRNIKTLQQLAKMKDEDRRSLLRGLNDDQYKDVIRVLALIPFLDMQVETEVVDDEEQHVVTAGAIVTVTLVLTRKTMESLMSGTASFNDKYDENEDKDIDPEDLDDMTAEALGHDDSEAMVDTAGDDKNKQPKQPVWKKPQKKKSGKKSGGGGKSKSKPKQSKGAAKSGAAPGEEAETDNKASEQTTSNRRSHRRRNAEGGSDDESSDESESEKEEKENLNTQSNPDDDDDEAEWEKFQKKLNKREKILEGKSRISHSVHCPYFTDDKQEHWWAYIADKKNHALMTPPQHITSLVEREEVELKFSAPPKPGHYTFTVCVKSDSYLGIDLMEDIKLDVQHAREAPTEHPQWEFEDEDEENNSKAEESDDQFATDDEDDLDVEDDD